ncbi:MAG: SPW repeat protein [Calditrichia bacterium]
MWASWMSFIIGIWLFVSGWIPGLEGEVNMIIAGALAFMFGFIAYKTWQGVINGLLGAWIFVSGIWFGLDNPANYLIIGVAMAILGLWGALPHEHEHHVEHTTA